ncbi:MAG TPA: rod shape-determining protein RodA [Bacteroidales bacterium]|nr:rod shape-determining protein RodA [Bacteroidales bacterium]
MNNRYSVFSNIDWLTIALYFIIMLFGWVNIYSAVFDEAHQSMFDISQRYGKQMLWIGAALVLAFFIMLIDSKIFENFSFLMYILILILLIAVLMGGKEIAGSKSWFQIGGIAIQPAEFAKFATALALAKYLTQPGVAVRKFKYLLRAAIIVGLPAVLILLQNDTGSMLVFSAFALVLYREGMPAWILVFALVVGIIFLTTLMFGKWMVISFLSAILLLTFYFIRKQKKMIAVVVFFFALSAGLSYGVDYAFENVLEPHQQTRINVLLGKEIDNRGAGYNVHQSKIAIGSGGLLGKGFLEGTQTKFNFVPEQSTDFIFCTVGEEWGFAGSSALIILYVMLFIRLVFLAERQRSHFSRIYGYGVLSVMFFHFAINIGMTIGLVPVIGIPLPFFSYGGSSLWSFTILLFIFLKFDAERKQVFI